MSLTAEFERVELKTERPFTIARGTTTTTENIVVRISDDAREGVGAAAPSARYGESATTVAAVLPDLLAVVEEVGDPHELDRIEHRMAKRIRRNPAARAAVDIALYDLICKRLDVPLYRYLGLDPTDTVTSSLTISIADTPEMRQTAEEAVGEGFDVLKVKLGTDRDLEIVQAVRSVAPDARIRVDANEAWTPREAVRKVEALAEHGVEFVEQPVPAENHDGLRFVNEHSALPIVADESCETLTDVPEVVDCADVVNLKLMKCGGIREAVRMIHAARAHGLEVMLGCMLETNASIAAGANLTPLLDYADLDGSLLLADDLYEGIPMPGGKIDLVGFERPGTGARHRAK